MFISEWRGWLNWFGIASNLIGFALLWREYSIAVQGAENRENAILDTKFDNAIPSPQQIARDHSFARQYGRYAEQDLLLRQARRAAMQQEKLREERIAARTTINELSRRRGYFHGAAAFIVVGAAMQLVGATPLETFSGLYRFLGFYQCTTETYPLLGGLPYLIVAGVLLLAVGGILIFRTPPLAARIDALEERGLQLAKMITNTASGAWRNQPAQMRLNDLEGSKERLREIHKERNNLVDQQKAKFWVPVIGLVFTIIGIASFCMV